MDANRTAASAKACGSGAPISLMKRGPTEPAVALASQTSGMLSLQNNRPIIVVPGSVITMTRDVLSCGRVS